MGQTSIRPLSRHAAKSINTATKGGSKNGKAKRNKAGKEGVVVSH